MVWASEFGRSPWSQNTTGRDHNPKGYTAWLAGGGVKGGVVHGATDDVGYKAVENPHYSSDLHATILHQLGLDHRKMEVPVLGRTMKLVEEGHGPIQADSEHRDHASQRPIIDPPAPGSPRPLNPEPRGTPVPTRIPAFLAVASVHLFVSSAVLTAQEEDQAPPPGFVALFDGKSLDGWHGMPHFDPRKLAAMGDEERAKKLAEWTEDARAHWRVEDGQLVNDGKGAYLTTDKEYGDIELWIDYKTVAKADSGVYLRGTPQVQIWDTTKEGGKWDRGADKGSGGLFNNSPGVPRPRPARPGRQAVRRVEPSPHPPGRGADDGRPERQAGRRPRHDGELLGSLAAPLRSRADPAPDPRRRDPLAESLDPGDPGGRGESDPGIGRGRGVPAALRRQEPRRLGRGDRQL